MTIHVSFPLNSCTSSKDVFQECVNWILDSPFTEFAEEDLRKLNNEEDFKHSSNQEVVEFSRSETPSFFVSSFRYTKHTANTSWITEISTRIEPDQHWISVKASIVTSTASDATLEVKKPLIVIRLIDRFGGGHDGDIPISLVPITLDESPLSLNIAKAVINGDSSCTLPIVYISANAASKHSVIPERLARKLCGMAHIVVEPSRTFSHILRRDVGSRNVYGGVVGIYWPKGSGVTVFRRGDKEVKTFEQEVFSTICEALSLLIPAKECSWDEVTHVKNRNAIELMKREGVSADEANQIVSLYEKEIAQNRDNIDILNREIERLNTIVRHLESKTPVQGGIIINTGDEEDFFDSEIFVFVLSALKDYIDKNTYANSRKEHVLRSVVNSNNYIDLHEQKSKILKESLRSYREMSKNIKDTLQDLGFNIKAEGKHWKLTYFEDERYTYVLPKTGSDHRGGLNAYADIANIAF
ncbi:MAG: hypothetical protein JJK56_13490 [Pseudomonas sp.]|uniref:hypothetical protein n=1 Tax=unclassified Pseudomonas TaxID=196821 RepID=UPI001472B981|nr:MULTISPECIES: hypothetical protein [unclassified Pseudomonas]MBL7228985.1 hypothetical protein [Pseudomonas sp.]NMY20540.1 hypothetical protein [Pseudomonas sp. WS 5410]